MKRYVVKAKFSCDRELEKTVSKLRLVGVPSSNIDCMEGAVKSKQGLKIKRESRKFEVAAKLFLFGLVLGGVLGGVYFFTKEDLVLSRFEGILYLAFSALCGGGLFSILGFILGQESKRHVLVYEDNPTEDLDLMLAVNTDNKLVDEVKTVIEHSESDYFDVIDVKEEVELGLRYQ